MFEQIITPRTSAVCTPEQLAAFGRFDCPPQYLCESPQVLNPDYELIQTFIDAATDHVEVLAATAILPEQVLLTFDSFPDQADPRLVWDYLLYSFDLIALWWRGHPTKESIEPVRRPVLTLSSPQVDSITNPVVTYNNPEGVPTVLDPESYTVFANKLTLNVGYHWPPTDRRQDCVQVTYWAGHYNVPSRLLLAVMFLANHFSENRAVVSVENTSQIHLTLCAILKPYMSFRIPR